MQQSKRAFVNGVFDLLHPGHLELLKFAKQDNNLLVVAIDSDRRTIENKRLPIYNENVRRTMLEAVRYVNRVKIFDSDQELERIVQELSPDIMVVGEEYKDTKVIGSQYAKELLFFPRIKPYSTSRTLEAFASR